MDRISKAKEKFNELFGGEPTYNLRNDPEFMYILQNFIFGEISQTGSLNDKMRELITITVLTVNQTLLQLKAHVAAALHVGLLPLEIRETIYQCAPFIGFPKVLNAIDAMNEVFISNEIKLPLEGATTVTEENRFEKGLAIQKPIYGFEIASRYTWLPKEYDKLVPTWLTELCFGDFATRKGLDVKSQELLTVVMLAAMGGAEVQVRSHVVGALKVGNTKEEVVCAFTQAMPYMGIPRLFNALNCCKDVLEK